MGGDKLERTCNGRLVMLISLASNLIAYGNGFYNLFCLRNVKKIILTLKRSGNFNRNRFYSSGYLFNRYKNTKLSLINL